jgi:hypothetical protein
MHGSRNEERLMAAMAVIAEWREKAMRLTKYSSHYDEIQRSEGVKYGRRKGAVDVRPK